MTDCIDLCTKAECEALRRDLDILTAEFRVLRAQFKNHINEPVREDDNGAHRFVPSKKNEPKFYLTYYPAQNLLKGQIDLNNKTAKAETKIDLKPKLDLTYYPDQNLLKGQVKIGNLIGKGETKIDLKPKLDLTYYPDQNLLKGQVKIGKLIGKGETTIKTSAKDSIGIDKFDLTFNPENNLLIGSISSGNRTIKSQAKITLKDFDLDLKSRLFLTEKGNLVFSLSINNKKIVSAVNIREKLNPVLGLSFDKKRNLCISFVILGEKAKTCINIPGEESMDYTEILNEIKEKVTVTSFIKRGHCADPTTEGDYMSYQEDQERDAIGIAASFTFLSDQVARLHEDTCKSISPKVKIPPLPKYNRCFFNEETEKHEVGSFDILDIVGDLGIIIPALLTGNKAIVIEELIKIGLGFLWDFISSQHKDALQGQCDSENDSNSPYVLLPDPRGIWNTDGWYLFFHWVIKDPKNEREKNYSTKSQIARPIDEIIYPSDPESVWDEYFAGIYHVLGNQFGSIYASDKRRRSPLYRGWFRDVDEGSRFLSEIAKLSVIEVREEGGKIFPLVEDQPVKLVNAGRTLILRKVCVGWKGEDTDEITDLKQYRAPKR